MSHFLLGSALGTKGKSWSLRAGKEGRGLSPSKTVPKGKGGTGLSPLNRPQEKNPSIQGKGGVHFSKTHPSKEKTRTPKDFIIFTWCTSIFSWWTGFFYWWTFYFYGRRVFFLVVGFF